MNFTVTTTIADKNLFHIFIQRHGPANIYLFKVSNRNTRKSYEMFSKLTIKKPERRQQLVFLLLTFSLTPFSRVSIADFEQVNVSRGLSKTWERKRGPFGFGFDVFMLNFRLIV